MGSVRLAASYLADGIYADMERRNLQLQQNYYRELEANQKQIRKLRHDLNNHLMVVGRLFEEGKRAEAQKYFEQLSGRALSSSRTCLLYTSGSCLPVFGLVILSRPSS